MIKEMLVLFLLVFGCSMLFLGGFEAGVKAHYKGEYVCEKALGEIVCKKSTVGNKNGG